MEGLLEGHWNEWFVGRSIGRSVGRSVGRAHGRSLVRSLDGQWVVGAWK